MPYRVDAELVDQSGASRAGHARFRSIAPGQAGGHPAAAVIAAARPQ
jgi:hypothetical protein